MLTSFDIPDPFANFVAKKYSKAKGLRYDFFTGEWSYECRSCSELLEGPNKKTITKIRLYHTRNECLGGY